MARVGRSGWIALGIALVVALAARSGASQPLPADPSAGIAEAKRLFREAEALRKAGDCDRALEPYDASRRLVPSLPNTLNAAICLDELGRPDEALELYELVLRRYEPELTPAERNGLAPAIARLRAELGSLEIDADVEARLVVSGRDRGALPRVTALPLRPGTHRVVVFRDGYESYEREVIARRGERTTVHAHLEPLRASGELVVAAASADGLAPLEVWIDGARVGTVPWRGTLLPGPHVVQVVGLERGSAIETAVVVAARSVERRLALHPLGPEIDVTVDPPSAALALDGVPVGRGSFHGKLPLGSHELEASEPGYRSERARLEVLLDMPRSRRIQLAPDEAHPRWGERGHVVLALSGGPLVAAALGSEIESNCAREGCAGHAALGGAFALRVGYELPFGLVLDGNAGYLALTRHLTHEHRDSFVAHTGHAVATHYTLDAGLALAGPFVGAGIGYRLPLVAPLALETHLGVWALFARTRAELGGEAGAASGSSLPFEVSGSGHAAAAAALVVVPEVALALRVAEVRATLGFAAAFLPLAGPILPTGDANVPLGSCGPGSYEHMACAPGEDFAARPRGAGGFVALWPTLGVEYPFQ